jgi:hypothetical protein
MARYSTLLLLNAIKLPLLVGFDLRRESLNFVAS